jgi:hypothetical protein
MTIDRYVFLSHRLFRGRSMSSKRASQFGRRNGTATVVAGKRMLNGGGTNSRETNRHCSQDSWTRGGDRRTMEGCDYPELGKRLYLHGEAGKRNFDFIDVKNVDRQVR